MKKALLVLVCLLFFAHVAADPGYRLWLRYEVIRDAAVRSAYLKQISGYYFGGVTPTLRVARNELKMGLNGLLGTVVEQRSGIDRDGLVLAVLFSDPVLNGTKIHDGGHASAVGDEGYVIVNTVVKRKKVILIAANTDKGILYGTFHFLRLLQTHQPVSALTVVEKPRLKLRMLNHWDNLDRTVERGYAGFSLWDWHKLPDHIDPRYTDYARANASIGINGSVLTNVNANALVLTTMYLEKVKALADLFRPYGIKVYLTARFSAPIEVGGLKTADPLDPAVRRWWTDKVQEIYRYIPDFGGFLVKANSEGQPGPQNYGRSHAQGANMFADVLEPFGGVVIWRAFVYSSEVPEDRTKQSYSEFKPLDGKFGDNVLIQVKNGPLDFQPREPIHPLFGAMPASRLMPEFQLTQEYLGFSTHLVFLPTLFKETLDTDTRHKGTGMTVAKIIDGTVNGQSLTGMAGVANIGTDANWTGHHFAQANWYGFGRLAWDHRLSPQQIADEWARMTFTNEAAPLQEITDVMLGSREAAVKYMTPLGLHHIMGYDHHYGPAPWISDKPRPEWTSVYYHRADSLGVGFDRSPTGTNALEQYAPAFGEQFLSMETCPEEFLLWFHHVGWGDKLKSGRTLWEELCYQYYAGVDSVAGMQTKWNTVKGHVDEERFDHVSSLLAIQHKEAIWWRNACLLYFQTFSKMAFPEGLTPPDKPLSYYQKLSFPYAPGIKPKW